MSSIELSRLPAYRRQGSQERLLRAAIYAFCSLPRPSRREIAQLDDLALPLIEKSSTETRRYVAAALSECVDVPLGVVRRLCDEPVEVSAPLLMKRRELCDIDLIALIGRHGMAHARAIGMRRDLHPRIANLISTLEKIDATATEAPTNPGKKGEEVRAKLRTMMESAQTADAPAPRQDPIQDRANAPAPARWREKPHVYEKLRSVALTGTRQLFAQCLAQTLRLTPAQGDALTSEQGRNELPIALRSLDFSAEQAFLVAACIFGQHYAHPEAVRQFLDRFNAMSAQSARATVRDWKMSAIPGLVENDIEWEDVVIPPAANESADAPAAAHLKAS
ncbi:MAG: hypothetical protein ACK4F5_05065 [Aliihoeflea sp.]